MLRKKIKSENHNPLVGDIVVARTVHGTMTTLNGAVDVTSSLGHSREGLDRGVMRGNAANFEQELLNPAAEKSHDLGSDVANLLVL